MINNRIEVVKEIKTELSLEEIEDNINVLMFTKTEYQDKIANIDDELEMLINFKNNNKKLFDNLKTEVTNITKS